MKDGEQLVKRFVLDEGNPNETDGFKRRLRESIKEAIQNSFLADDSKYANGDDLANEQTCFYVIKQDDAYQPFSYLSVPESHIENFKLSDAQVYLRTFSDVENIIDLFTERYTKSEVTGQEYDTSVKDKAEPISNSNIA